MSVAEVAERIDALADEHPERADEAAAWLLERPDLSRPPLAELVAAGRPDQRTRQAVRLLGRLGNPADVHLLAALLARPASGLAWEAAQALVLHQSDDAHAALQEATRSSWPETVQAAASALGERGDERARPTLEALLAHPEASVRHRAVHALGQLGADRSAERLREAAARDESADVRALIGQLLNASS